MFIITPCRLSFVLCAVLTLLIDVEHGQHLTVADPPRQSLPVTLTEGSP